MSMYDVAFVVMLRLESNKCADIALNIEKYSEKLGDLIEEEYPNLIVAPVGMELVEDDGKVRILNKITYTEFEEEDEEEEWE